MDWPSWSSRAGSIEVETLNNRLRELREAKGLSQGELAEQLDVSRQTINALETGKYDPSLPLAFRIARLFSGRIEQIFIYEEQ